MGQMGHGGTGIEERMYPTTPLPPVNIGHTLYLRIFGLRGKLKFTYYRGYSIHTYVQTGRGILLLLSVTLCPLCPIKMVVAVSRYYIMSYVDKKGGTTVFPICSHFV